MADSSTDYECVWQATQQAEPVVRRPKDGSPVLATLAANGAQVGSRRLHSLTTSTTAASVASKRPSFQHRSGTLGGNSGVGQTGSSPLGVHNQATFMDKLAAAAVREDPSSVQAFPLYSHQKKENDIANSSNHRSSLLDEEDEATVDLAIEQQPDSESQLQDEVAAVQKYVYLPDVNFAIPVCDYQTYIKLADGQKRDVDLNQVYTVEYDCRGLPIRTVSVSNGSHQSWVLEKPGMGVKMQRYFVHQSLLHAVPVVVGQNSVTVTDGDVIPITQADVISIFYDAKGKAAFHFAGYGSTKIRPGGVTAPQGGFAHRITYFAIGEPGQGVTERCPIYPITAMQSFYRVNNVVKPVDRKRIAIAFHDSQDNNVVPYSQVEDGSLIYGSLYSRYDEPLKEAPLSSNEGLLVKQSGPQGRSASTRPQATHSLNNNPESSKNNNAHERNHLSGASGSQEMSRGQSCSASISAQPALSIPGPEYRKTSNGDVERVTYVEVPKEVEIIKRIPIKRTEILERRVPRQEIEIVERILEVPEIVYVDKPVEVERIEYTTTIVKKKEVIERPVEQIRYVPKIEKRIVEKIIEVPQIVEVPKLEIVERKVPVDVFHDKKEQVVVAQKVNPVIRQSETILEKVECLTLEPELVIVDVFVPKPIAKTLIPVGVTSETQHEAKVPAAHMNALTISMNPHMQGNFEKLPLVKINNGSFPVLPKDARLTVLPPSADIVKDLLFRAKLIKPTPVVQRQVSATNV